MTKKTQEKVYGLVNMGERLQWIFLCNRDPTQNDTTNRRRYNIHLEFHTRHKHNILILYLYKYRNLPHKRVV
jgi:hypothetical protein